MTLESLLLKNDGTGRQLRQGQVDALTWVHKNWKSNNHLILQASVGCHAMGTDILMYDGTVKPVEKIVKGDVLMGPDSTPRTVLTLFSGQQQMFNIIPVKGEPFTVNANHVLSLKRTPRKKGDKHVVENVSVAEYLTYSNHRKNDLKLYYVNKIDYSKKALKIPPYILGIWLGDGSYIKSTLNLTKHPGLVMDTWCKWIEERGDGYSIDDKKGCLTARVRCDARWAGVPNTRRLFDFYQLTSSTKHIPFDFLTSDYNDRLELLAGILDTDGSVSHGGFDWISVSKELAENVLRLVRSVGLAAYLSQCQKKCFNNGVIGTYYRISISGNCEQIPTRVKIVETRKQIKNVNVTGFTVEPLNVGNYFGFEVDCDNLYVMGSHLVTHNSGKSNIIKSMQDYFGGNIVTSQNALIEQYVKDYPQLNKVIGRQHYKCHVEGGSCGYYSMAKSCRGDEYLPCPLRKSRENIKTHSIFNAMSAFMLRKQYKVSGGINYIDEAHTLLSMVRLMGTHTIVPQKQLLKKAGIARHELNNELKVIKYLEVKRDRLLELSGKDVMENTKAKHEAEIENITFTIDCLENSPELYVIQEKDGRVYVFPLKAPRFVLDKIIGHTGVLTSATMVRHDIVELLGREEYPFLSLRSEIPAANRPVVLHKQARNMAQDQISPRYIADLIADIYEKNRVATMVHVTYSMAEQISQYLKVPHLIHGKEDKKEVLETFLQKGGVLLGAGMAEGLDLKDDLCRQQIIVKIQFPNFGDMWVQKRKALLDGETWYAAEAYKIFAQQVGRSTRHKNDYSITHVLDNRLPRVIQQWDRLGILPDYLKESIQL